MKEIEAKTWFHFLAKTKPLKDWDIETVIISLIVILFLALIAFFATRRLQKIPAGAQNLLELITEKLTDFLSSIIGPEGRKLFPFFGTLFVYIFIMNLMGLVPGMKSPTADLNTTIALALSAYFFVQYVAIKERGFIGYIKHLAGTESLGEPSSFLGWVLRLPLNLLFFVLHFIGALGGLAAILSLSMRLFGNMFGKEVVLMNFIELGYPGIPLTFFVICLALLISLIQAFIFFILTSIYISVFIGGHEEESK